MTDASPATSDPRPPSAVSAGVGLAGLAGLLAWMIVAWLYRINGPYGALVALLACALPMVAWSIMVDKVQHSPSTGIDWARRPRWAETRDISFTKLAGLWATWGLIACAYMVGRWYWEGQYVFAMQVLAAAVPFLLLLSIPYVFWIDRRLVEPRDGAYAFGQLLMGRSHDRRALIEHGRSWAVKGFFTAFMISIVPGNYADVVNWEPEAFAGDPVSLARFLIGAMFLIDVMLATVGYLLTLRPLDAHIRSANPYAAGWLAALICYPPFILMSDGGPLDYHQGTQDWSIWLAAHPVLLWITGGVLVLLTGIYAWATMAFGLRFSNLTHRGVLTHGPYRWSRHPAYLSKNLFWWIASAPFLVTTGSIGDAARNTAILALVSGVYYWRARTEEAHLSADPAYRRYAAWMDRNAPLPRLARWIAGERAGSPVAAE